jgi:hypothetical protein
MKNLMEWVTVCVMCLAFGATLILYPLISFLIWNPLWLLDIGSWNWVYRLGLLFAVVFCAFVFYGIVRYGYKQ